MLKARIIPCLDVKDGRVVKGVNFVGLRDAGDPVEVAKRYDIEGADELTFLDIGASHEGRDTIVDVVNDSWVPGMPIAVRLENDSPNANAARSAVQQKAGPFANKYGIQSSHGVVLAHNPVSEISADPKRVRFRPFKTTTNIGDPIEVTLNEYPLPAGGNCGVHGQTFGYRLLLSQPGKVKLLHEDSRIPKSRGCPLAYRIDQVIAYHVAGGDMMLAIMLVMNVPGFEGPDGKYLAVTTRVSR